MDPEMEGHESFPFHFSKKMSATPTDKKWPYSHLAPCISLPKVEKFALPL